MKRNYLCPHCKVILNPNVKIILRAERKGRRGLFLFSPRPGTYDVHIPHDFPLEEGDPVDFACPACGRDLTSARGESWAEILFRSPGRDAGTAVFSKIYGHHATCFITEEQVKWYGEDSSEGVNFWGAGPDRER